MNIKRKYWYHYENIKKIIKLIYYGKNNTKIIELLKYSLIYWENIIYKKKLFKYIWDSLSNGSKSIIINSSNYDIENKIKCTNKDINFKNYKDYKFNKILIWRKF